MSVHRFAALGIAVSLLNLNIAQADVVCAAHEHSAAAGESTTEHPAAEHHMSAADAAGEHESGTHEAARQEQCDTPVQSACCEALASCSLVLGENGDPTAESGTRPPHSIVAALASRPLSLVATPDLPPPRA